MEAQCTDCPATPLMWHNWRFCVRLRVCMCVNGGWWLDDLELVLKSETRSISAVRYYYYHHHHHIITIILWETVLADDASQGTDAYVFWRSSLSMFSLSTLLIALSTHVMCWKGFAIVAWWGCGLSDLLLRFPCCICVWTEFYRYNCSIVLHYIYIYIYI